MTLLTIIAAALLMLLQHPAHIMGQAAVVTYLLVLLILKALAMVVAGIITASGGLQSITKVLASALLILQA